MQSHPNVKYYLLYDADETGNLSKLASFENGDFSKTSKYIEDYDMITTDNNDSEIEETRNTVITEEYIKRAKEQFALKDFQIKGLKRYIGKTFKQALDDHSTSLE